MDGGKGDEQVYGEQEVKDSIGNQGEMGTDEENSTEGEAGDDTAGDTLSGTVSDSETAKDSATINESADYLECPQSDTEFIVRSSKVEGALLTLEVKYGGGCEEHSFSVGWNGIAAASDPPIAPVEIHHYDHDDTCKAMLDDTLYIDLSALDVLNGLVLIDLMSSDKKRVAQFTYDPSETTPTFPESTLPIREECSHLEP